MSSFQRHHSSLIRASTQEQAIQCCTTGHDAFICLLFAYGPRHRSAMIGRRFHFFWPCAMRHQTNLRRLQGWKVARGSYPTHQRTDTAEAWMEAQQHTKKLKPTLSSSQLSLAHCQSNQSGNVSVCMSRTVRLCTCSWSMGTEMAGEATLAALTAL